MRMRRLDPVYRSIERVRDRIRRKISRKEHPEKREVEKERDRMSKRLHRLRMVQLIIFDHNDLIMCSSTYVYQMSEYP